MREDRADHGARVKYMLPCLQTYTVCSVECKTIVLDFQ